MSIDFIVIGKWDTKCEISIGGREAYWPYDVAPSWSSSII